MLRRPPTIIATTESAELWRDDFADRDSWAAWFTFLKAMFCLPMDEDERKIFTTCTDRAHPPTQPLREAWLVVGRRGGKSKILALIACYLAVFKDWSPYLSRGETGTIKIIATDRRQARVIYGYAEALLIEVPVLAALVRRRDSDTIELINGIAIEIQTASFRTIRGYTVIACLCDEIAYWRSESFANPDFEILDAVRPAMATIPEAMLLCAGSPYARRGALWQAHRRYWGETDSPVLVWQAASKIMHPILRQEVIDEAYERDPVVAASEYGAEFRKDLEAYVAREVVEAQIIPGRFELPPLLYPTRLIPALSIPRAAVRIR